LFIVSSRNSFTSCYLFHSSSCCALAFS